MGIKFNKKSKSGFGLSTKFKTRARTMRLPSRSGGPIKKPIPIQLSFLKKVGAEQKTDKAEKAVLSFDDTSSKTETQKIPLLYRTKFVTSEYDRSCFDTTKDIEENYWQELNLRHSASLLESLFNNPAVSSRLLVIGKYSVTENILRSVVDVLESRSKNTIRPDISSHLMSLALRLKKFYASDDRREQKVMILYNAIHFLSHDAKNVNKALWESPVMEHALCPSKDFIVKLFSSAVKTPAETFHDFTKQFGLRESVNTENLILVMAAALFILI